MAAFLLAMIFFFSGSEGADRERASSDVGLAVMMAVLSNAHASGSLEYWGNCELGSGKRFDLPRLRYLDSAVDDPIAALREIFADYPHMRVTRDANGFIRMAEADVPHDLLDVSIKHIAFKDDEAYPPTDVRYVPRDAMWAILSRPEVSAFMKDHEIVRRFDIEDASGQRPIPSPVLPHLPEGLNNVTLSQALDNVLQTFPGLWVYENCPSKKSKRIVDFAIYQNGPAWSAPAQQHGP
jgi:hypothetical protein